MRYLKRICLLLGLGVHLVFTSCSDSKIAERATETKENLVNWLAENETERPPLYRMDFAQRALTTDEAQSLTQLLLDDKKSRLLEKYGDQWDNRLLTLDQYEMPFFYHIFGEEPADGRSLYISMHGGGGTTAEINDQQYENQKHLYDLTMTGLEGVYLAPRAPTNTWNLWHQAHIDEFMNLIIQMAVIKENVNPNKVYLLGYSAGGDGVYQLAPRMADRWAAASMMAGHPNDASPLGLRNTPFAIHVGEFDKPYDRNLIARKWGDELKILQTKDPKGYIHDVQIHSGLGHWMKRQDSVALSWMKDFSRNPIPEKVIWKQDDRHHQSFYWLAVSKDRSQTGDLSIAEFDQAKNQILLTENSADEIQIYLNDEMLNLDRPVSVIYQDKVIGTKTLDRTILNMYNSLDLKGDAYLTFTAKVSVIGNEKIE